MQEETPVTPHVGGIPPQFNLTGGALVQLATALANVIRSGREDASPSQGEQISSERRQEEEDESYIPLSSQKQKARESLKLGSQTNKGICIEEDVESKPGKKYC